MRYAALVARAFAPISPAELDRAWRALDRETEAALEAAKLDEARKRAAWEQLDKAGPGGLDEANDWSGVVTPAKR